jgi:hypothetical protein
MIRRVERLERTIGASNEPAARTVISVDFVSAADGKVVRSLVLEPGQPERWVETRPLLGPHRALCGDATSAEAVARLLGERKPRLMVTDPPYGISLDSEWRVHIDHSGPREMQGNSANRQRRLKGDPVGKGRQMFSGVIR